MVSSVAQMKAKGGDVYSGECQEAGYNGMNLGG